jgi:hypothetical protein
MRRTSRGVWLSVCAALALAPAARAATAKEVVEKAIEAHGGTEAIKKMKFLSAKSTGKLSIMGLDIPIEGEALYAFPDKARNVLKMEVANQKVTVTQIINGDKIKMSVADMAPPLSDAQKGELRESVALQLVMNLTPLLEGKDFEISSIENPPKVKDKEVDGVLVKSKKLKDVKLFFDKESHRLVKLTRKGLDPTEAEVDQEIYMTEFKKYDGVLRPSKVEIMMDGKKFLESEITDVKILDKVDPKEFDVSD